MFAQIISGDDVFNQLADEWDGLTARGMTDTPFQKLDYQRSWWNNLRPQDGSLHTIVVRQEGGELAAILCLSLTPDGVLRFNGCIEETDYLDLICTGQDAKDSWGLIFPCLLSADFPAWQHMELCNIPEASPTRVLLPEVAARHAMTVRESIYEVCPIIDLPGTFEEYLDGLESKQRREIQRKMRRAAGAEAELHIVSPEEDLSAAVDDFLVLLQKSTFEKRDWLDDGRRQLFHETAQSAQDSKTLQLMFLEVNGQKAAALFNFDYAGRIWVYNSGLDPDLFAGLSAGVVITALAIENAIEDGREEFDFLRGNETYKYRFGAKDTAVFRLQTTR